MKISFQIFDLILRNFVSFLTEAALGRNICKYLYWNLKKKWWSDESARHSTLLKLESTTDIFIDQVNKFQNSDFKEYPWKAAAGLQKACILRTCYETLDASIFVSSFLNIV